MNLKGSCKKIYLVYGSGDTDSYVKCAFANRKDAEIFATRETRGYVSEINLYDMLTREDMRRFKGEDKEARLKNISWGKLEKTKMEKAREKQRKTEDKRKRVLNKKVLILTRKNPPKNQIEMEKIFKKALNECKWEV